MATLTFHQHARGVPGFLYTFSTGTVGVIPAVSLVDPDTSAQVGTSSTPLTTTSGPSGAAGAAITPVVASAASALVVKASAGNLYGASMTAGATAGFFIAYNAAAAPAGGAALTAAQILAVVPVAANGFASIGDFSVPDRFSTGIVLLFSTATTTYTVPANAALHMRGKGV